MTFDDVYHDRRIVRDGVVPSDVVDSSQGFRPQCVGLDPPGGVRCHITGTDLVRHGDGTVHVLEDNLRCPSGVSYVLENRAVMQETFPAVFEGLRVRPVNDYPSRLLTMLEEVAPRSLGRLVAELDYTDVADVIRAGLHGFLDSLQDRLNDIGDEITRTFFAPPVAPGGRV